MKAKPHSRAKLTRKWPEEQAGCTIKYEEGWQCILDDKGVRIEKVASLEESKSAVRAGIEAGIKSIDRLIAILRDQEPEPTLAEIQAKDPELSRMGGAFAGRVVGK